MREKLKGLLKRLNLQMLGIYLAVIVGGSALLGFVVQLVITNIDAVLLGLPFEFDLLLLDCLYFPNEQLIYLYHLQ